MGRNQKRMSAGFAAGGLAVVLASAGGALAHHSFAMFDNSKEVSVQGTVADWQWTNPHSWLELKVTENGKVVNYSIEGSSPNVLLRRGWTRKALKPGDVVTVQMFPLKNGDKGGQLRRVIFGDGKFLEST
jgi:hypothetical protein